MSRLVFITPAVAVAGALAPADFAAAARRGFGAVIDNRHDGEEAGQLPARQEAVLAWHAGLRFRHIPAAKHEALDDRAVEAVADALATLPGPVLLHCKSGQRSALLWAAASARAGQPITDVLAIAKAAGFDLSELREEIAGHAGRSRRLARPTLAAA